MTQAEQYEADVKANPTRLIRFEEWLEAKCNRLEAANAEMLLALHDSNDVFRRVWDHYNDEPNSIMPYRRLEERRNENEKIIQRNIPKEG